MAILDSVNELAKRFGVETEEQTISEQIDAINQKLDESYTGSRDIEESVSQFAKNDGPDARLGTKSITENGTYTALDDELDGYSSVTVNVPSAPTPETFEVEVEITITGGGYITTVNKTYQQIKSEIDLGKTISGTLTGFYDSSELFSGELSNSYVKDFYGISGTKEADDAIFIVTEPLLYTDPSHSQTMSAIFSVAITPDNIVWMTAGYSWSSNPET